ncbi:MAG TPA: hypothetical protein VKA08_14430, partial [Balneolales bacterium]|nr:hypothetical protein [Balneolales bacterium]
PRLNPLFLIVEFLHDGLGMIRIIPESGLLCLILELFYPVFAIIIVKDTSSAHPRAETIRTTVRLYIVLPSVTKLYPFLIYL